MQRLRQIAVSLCVLTCFAIASSSRNAAQEIAAFNERFTEAIRQMNNAVVLSLWADDGVSLLPGSPPIVGKTAIAKFMEGATSKTAGFKVVSHENDFHDLKISGEWASEWAVTTQVVQPPNGEPQMTIHGKMLLVLHRDKGGAWKIENECWAPGS